MPLSNPFRCLLVFSLLIACSGSPTDVEKNPPIDDDPMEEEPTKAVQAVGFLTAADFDNKGNGSDIRVRFTRVSSESKLSEYRLLVVRAEKKEEFGLAEANMVPPTSFFSRVPDGLTNIEIDLAAGLNDADGEGISEGISYVVFILSVANDTSYVNALSKPSSAFDLRKTNLVKTIANLPAATGGVDVDALGNIYVADIGAAPSRQGVTVYKVTPAGGVTVFAQGQGLLGASGNAFDSQGNLFQSNLSNNTISKISPAGEVSLFVSAGIAGPVGIAIDESDNLYVANCGNNSIQKVTPAAQSSLLASSALLRCPNGITLAEDGNLYVANFNDGSIIRVTMSGQTTLFATVPGNNNGHLVYRDGLLYVAARGGHRFFTIDLSGEIQTLAGTGFRGHGDGTALNATFSLPNDLAFSPDGSKLYINEVNPTSGTANIPSILRVILLEEE